MRRAREVTPVPAKAAAVTSVEIVHLHSERRTEHGWVLGQRMTHRRSAAPLPPDDQQTGQEPCQATVLTGHHQTRAPSPPRRTEQISVSGQPRCSPSRHPTVPALAHCLVRPSRAHQPTIPSITTVIPPDHHSPWIAKRCTQATHVVATIGHQDGKQHLLPPMVGPSQYTGGVRVPLARHADLPTQGKAVQRVDGARGTAGVLRGVAGYRSVWYWPVARAVRGGPGGPGLR